MLYSRSIFCLWYNFFWLEPVQNFWTSSKFFELVQNIWNWFNFFLLVLFLHQTKKLVLAPSIFILPLLFHLYSTYLTYYSPLLSQHPSPYSFYLSAYPLWALNHRPLVFLWIHVLMSYHWVMETWIQFLLFFCNYIYTIVVIHFLELIHSSGNTFP